MPQVANSSRSVRRTVCHVTKRMSISGAWTTNNPVSRCVTRLLCVAASSDKWARLRSPLPTSFTHNYVVDDCSTVELDRFRMDSSHSIGSLDRVTERASTAIRRFSIVKGRFKSGTDFCRDVTTVCLWFWVNFRTLSALACRYTKDK